jgi:superfamily II DNA or RNA helicase
MSKGQQGFAPLNLISAHFIKYLLSKVILRDYQTRAAIHMCLMDYQLISFDTGLGKTVAMLAGLVAKSNSGTPLRILLLCPLAGMNQVYQSIKDFTHFRVTRLSGSAKGMEHFHKQITPDTDIVLCNYEAFDNLECLDLIRMLVQGNFFNTVVLDEAHVIANIYTSNRNFFIANVVVRMQYRYFLTATPIISDVQQYATLIAMLYGDLPNLGTYINRVTGGEFAVERVPNLVQFKERDTQYEAKLHVVDGVRYKGTCYGSEIFKYTRGEHATAVDNKMKELVADAPRRLLIFGHYKMHHKYLADLCAGLGRKVGVISSDTNKAKIQEEYLAGLLDCIIFSIPTELNLPADSIIMYDWTCMAHQAIGRGLRSDKTDGYVAHFIVTDSDKELSLFDNTVVKNSHLLSQAFGKTMTQILQMEEIS